jgi:hypothetical protein
MDKTRVQEITDTGDRLGNEGDRSVRGRERETDTLAEEGNFVILNKTHSTEAKKPHLVRDEPVLYTTFYEH